MPPQPETRLVSSVSSIIGETAAAQPAAPTLGLLAILLLISP
jgi:hypothetical protein